MGDDTDKIWGEGQTLRHKHLRLSVRNGHTDLAISTGSVRNRPEATGVHSPLWLRRVEAVVSASATSTIGGDNNNITTSPAESIAVIGGVQMNMVIPAQPPRSLLHRHEFLNESVEVASGIVPAPPEILSVSGVVSTIVSLLCATVQYWDTAGEHGVSESILEKSPVIVDVQEALNVMVVYKCSQELRTGECRADLVVLIDEVPESGFARVAVVDRVVHGIVEDRRHVILVRANVSRVATEHFSNRVHAGSAGEAGPKVLLYMLHCVQAQSVDGVLGHQVLNPAIEDAAHRAILRLQVRESRDLALFDLGLVIPVVDAAIAVVVRACVEGVEGRDIARAHVIGYDIHHYVHALCMGRADEGFEVVC